MRAQHLPGTVIPSSLVLIAQVFFLLEHGHTESQTYKVTDAADHPTYASATASVGYWAHSMGHSGPLCHALSL